MGLGRTGLPGTGITLAGRGRRGPRAVQAVDGPLHGLAGAVQEVVAAFRAGRRPLDRAVETAHRVDHPAALLAGVVVEQTFPLRRQRLPRVGVGLALVGAPLAGVRPLVAQLRGPFPVVEAPLPVLDPPLAVAQLPLLVAKPLLTVPEAARDIARPVSRPSLTTHADQPNHRWADADPSGPA